MLSILLLGSPQVMIEGRAIHMARRKRRALIDYLAAHPHPVTREHLHAFLWPDSDRPAAQQVLRTTLHGLRKALGAALLVEDDTPEFDDWAAAERERYRRIAIRGWAALSQLHEESRRMRLASLDLWPDPPHLDVTYEPNPGAGTRNAVTRSVSGWGHDDSHPGQIAEIVPRSKAAQNSGYGGVDVIQISQPPREIWNDGPNAVYYDPHSHRRRNMKAAGHARPASHGGLSNA
jgi:hypothetical protein